VKEAEQRAEKAQNKIADKITAFSGSMAFVYIHSSGSDAGSASGSRNTRSGC